MKALFLFWRIIFLADTVFNFLILTIFLPRVFLLKVKNHQKLVMKKGICFFWYKKMPFDFSCSSTEKYLLKKKDKYLSMIESSHAQLIIEEEKLKFFVSKI